MLPLGHAVEASQDQAVVCAVPGVTGGNILEQMEVCPKDKFLTVPHLMVTIDHAPRLVIPSPW